MKRLLYCFILCLMAVSMAAQDTGLQRLAEKNSGMQTLNATVKRTRHLAALTEDDVTTGTFSLQKPGRMALVFLDGQDKLLMDGTVYTMVTKGKASVAQGKTHDLFSVLQDVLRAVMGDGDVADFEGRATLQWENKESCMTLTVTPSWEGSKRRMMFRSFVLTVDTRTSRLISLRMNERGDNYTQYDFMDYRPDTPVNDRVFQP